MHKNSDDQVLVRLWDDFCDKVDFPAFEEVCYTPYGKMHKMEFHRLRKAFVRNNTDKQIAINSYRQRRLGISHPLGWILDQERRCNDPELERAYAA